MIGTVWPGDVTSSIQQKVNLDTENIVQVFERFIIRPPESLKKAIVDWVKKTPV